MRGRLVKLWKARNGDRAGWFRLRDAHVGEVADPTPEYRGAQFSAVGQPVVPGRLLAEVLDDFSGSE